jgi:hypothetical protein
MPEYLPDKEGRLPVMAPPRKGGVSNVDIDENNTL